MRQERQNALQDGRIYHAGAATLTRYAHCQ
jgi:hypothetical protein